MNRHGPFPPFRLFSFSLGLVNMSSSPVLFWSVFLALVFPFFLFTSQDPLHPFAPVLFWFLRLLCLLLYFLGIPATGFFVGP